MCKFKLLKTYKKITYFSVLALIVSNHITAQATLSIRPRTNDIPYKTCNWKNKTYTDRLLAENFGYELRFTEGHSNSEAGALCIDCGVGVPYPYTSPTDADAVEIEALRSIVLSSSPEAFESNTGIPDICFYANMLRSNTKGSNQQFYHCKNSSGPPRKFSSPRAFMSFSSCPGGGEGEKEVIPTKNQCILDDKKTDPVRNLFAHGFCLNKEYVGMTAKAFNAMAKCFDFNKEETSAVFSALSHESNFMLNAKSENEARCYGQITGDLFADINKYIYARNNPEYSEVTKGNPQPKWLRYGKIYKDAVERCGNLSEKVFPQDVLKFRQPCQNNKKKRCIKSQAKLRDLSRKGNKYTCALTHDPYTCLFYSMYFMKMNHSNFDVTLPREPSEARNIPYEFKELFQNQNKHEVTIIQGKMKNKSSQKSKYYTGDDTLVMWDFSETAETFYHKECDTRQCKKTACGADSYEGDVCTEDCCNKYSYELGEGKDYLQIKQVPLFPEAVLRRFFTQTAHNGGTGIITNELKAFLQNMKLRISNRARCFQDRKCKTYRETLAQGESLDESVLLEEWLKYSERNKYDNRHEAKKFVKEIQSDHKYMMGSGNKMRERLEIHGIEDKDTQDRFIQDVENQCKGLAHSVQ